ncbi:MAG TPA: rhodanese-like domain-containing protein [Thermodesulfobacteriota bacterium]|nr:rhodanese-like domain-containing protein [Thermodesulfobacteriota bacterium]
MCGCLENISRDISLEVFLISASNLKYMEEHSFEGKLILYCTVGVRSYRAGKALAARGISTADLEGGIEAWEEAGGLVESNL